MADILIVDDEEDIRELIAEILSDEGHDTRTSACADSTFKERFSKPSNEITPSYPLSSSADTEMSNWLSLLFSREHTTSSRSLSKPIF